MDFARKQLLKYGWSDGKGLGKNENGISEALKPKLKRSVTGVGYDIASDFTEHWWSQLYDKAVGNVEVEEKNGKTKKIKTKESDNFEITTSTWRLSKKKQNKEGGYAEHFVRKSILTNGGSKVENVTESESDGESEKKDVFKMTDEELFAACEGRTAHKGARHGLKALGKLARIAQQEQMLLSQSRFNGYSHAEKLKQDPVANTLQVQDINLNSDADASVVKKKKKKRKRCLSQNSVSVIEKSINVYSNADKLNQDISVNDLQVVEDMNLNSDVEASVLKKKKKKRKRCISQNSASDVTEKTIFQMEYPGPEVSEKILEIGVASGNKISKKCKSVVKTEVIVDDCKLKESKKRKDYDDGEVEISIDQHGAGDESVIVKKRKKKKKTIVSTV